MSVKPCKVRSSGDTSDTGSSYVSEEEEPIDMIGDGDTMTDRNAKEQLSSPSQATEHDVFIGRGNDGFTKKNHGLYRKLIREHSKGYFEAPMGIKKIYIMDNIVHAIRKKGGDFYTNRSTKDYNVWKVASEESIIRKIKLAIMDMMMKEKEEKEKFKLPTAGGKQGMSETTVHSNARPYPKLSDTARLNNNMPNMPSTILNGIPHGIPQSCLIDAVRAQAKALAAVPITSPAKQGPPRSQIVHPNTSVASPSKTSVPQKKILYINEKTGHLLNMSSRENNLYHDLLIRHAGSFYKHFGKNNATTENLWNDDGPIRFVWDNIISELQRSDSFNIVLCPHSQKSIDIDPKKLQLLNKDPKHFDVTFRTIRSIISALHDRQYITAELAAKQQKNASTRRHSSNSLDMEMRKMQARHMQQSMQQQGQVPVLQQQQLPAFAVRQQDPAMVSNGSCSMDSTPQKNNDAVIAAVVAAAQMAQNKQNEETMQTLKEIQAIGAARDMVRSKLRNLQGLGEMASAVLTQDRQIQEQERQRQIEQQRRLQTERQVEQQRRLQMEQQLRAAMPVVANPIQPNVADMRNNMLHAVAAHAQRNQAIEQLRLLETAANASNQSRKISVPNTSNDAPPDLEKMQKFYAILPRQWNPNFTALLEFYVEHGSFEVPENYTEDPKLLHFVKSVRYLRKQKKRGGSGRFFDKWEHHLDKIGFPWEPPNGVAAPERSEREQRKFDCAILREFGRTHPDIRILLKSPRFAWIAKWVKTRKARAEEFKQEFNEEKLMELFGFEWEHPPAESPSTNQTEEDPFSPTTKFSQNENPRQRKRKLEDLNNSFEDDIVI